MIKHQHIFNLVPLTSLFLTQWIFVTHFASPGVPLDAPVLGCILPTSRIHHMLYTACNIKPLVDIHDGSRGFRPVTPSIIQLNNDGHF